MIPSNSVELFIPVNLGPHSGRYPAPNHLSSSGAGTDIDFDIHITPPLKIIIPPSVVINPGIPSFARKKPCHAPAARPIASAKSTAAHHGRFNSLAAIAITIPENPATDPTERSIWPITITISIPSAKTNTYALPARRF